MSREKYIGMDVHLATTISVRADSSIVAQPTDTAATTASLAVLLTFPFPNPLIRYKHSSCQDFSDGNRQV
jgi:hypothetical protein